MKTVLLAEDNVELSDMMSLYLERAGYSVITAYDGMEAIRFFDKADLVLLDIMLPKADGFSVCREIRKAKKIPIIVISARVGEDDKEKMFNLGVDDYMTKPFSLKEMVMRVNAQLRRYYEFNSISDAADKRYGDLVISVESLEAKWKGEILPLTVKEFKIIDYLTRNINRIVPKQKLIDEVWGIGGFIDENTLAVTVGRLREKLKQYDIDKIATAWGRGYIWKEE